MRSLWLLTPMLLALTTSLPATASPVHDLTSQVAASAIAPIEIKELVIRATVAEVAAPLAELTEQEEGFGNDLDAVVTLVYETLMMASDRCEADEKMLDAACVAETILSRLSQSPQVKEVIVKGWDPKGKRSAAHLKALAAKPTMDGAREVLVAVLGALCIEAREQGTSEQLLKYLQKAKAAGQDIEVENDETH